ncbi:DinB family protein [Nocardiopsis sp. FIRDI 009]|uniref:DinB family protein n=1 Tax=Nocardiopsis sp. FIRDI 009 TaxID=714197 RepID=UPI0018E55F4F|nr:DinB family protein [Nocardiopsis sp. FIRDI 009]
MMGTRVQNTTVDVERAALLRTLEEMRGNVRYTVGNLTDEQAGERTTISELCLGGVVKHLARGERGWIRFILDGDPGIDYTDPAVTAEHLASFRMEEGETLADLLAEYEEVAEETARIVNALPDLEISQKLPAAPWWPEGASWSARDVLLHIIAETAQHAGHADIIREAIDGQKTMG